MAMRSHLGYMLPEHSLYGQTSSWLFVYRESQKKVNKQATCSELNDQITEVSGLLVCDQEA